MKETVYFVAGIPVFLWGLLTIYGALRNTPRILKMVTRRDPEYGRAPILVVILALGVTVIAFGFVSVLGGGVMLVGVTWFDVKLKTLGLYSTFGEYPFVDSILYPLGLGSFCLLKLLAIHLEWDMQHRAIRIWTFLMYYLMGLAIAFVFVRDSQSLFCLNPWLLGLIVGSLITVSYPENWIRLQRQK
ncbi:MAG: hypothetical protein GY832_07585 [Chloroflexi bacterium]|nr:hypothetical protein [Chloroflexota bacterium]